MFCPQCGMETVDNARFCQNCASSLTSEREAPPVDRKMFSSSAWLVLWFVVLLAFNVLRVWSDYNYKSLPVLILDGLGRMTTPLQLALTAIVSLAFFTHQGSKRPKLYAGLSMLGTLGIALLAGLATALVIKSLLKSSNAPMSNYAVMQPSPAVVGDSTDGLTPDTKKRMREMLVLQLSGALAKSQSPVKVDIVGTNHDIVTFTLSSMDASSSQELIDEFRANEANFWNGMRLMDVKEVDFLGDNYKRAVIARSFSLTGKTTTSTNNNSQVT